MFNTEKKFSEMKKKEKTAPAAALPRTEGNENTGLIKLIAIACMIVDHAGLVFFPKVYEWRVIGRIAFPLFAWCLCVGAVYTRNIWKYALRLLIVGILSQPIYAWAMNHEWYSLNIFFELLLSLLAIAAVRENRMGSRYWGPAAALAAVFSLSLNHSYGWQGFLFIVLLYACRRSRPAMAAFMAAFCLYWGQGTVRLSSLFGFPLITQISFLPSASTLLNEFTRIQFWAILALPLILLPMGKRLRVPKWVAYAAYPVHLAVIGLFRHWDQIRLAVSRWL